MGFYEKNTTIDKSLINYQQNHSKKIKALVRYEMILLRIFGFFLYTNCRKKFLVTIIELINQNRDMKNLMQEALNLSIDYFQTRKKTNLNTEVIVCGSIYFMARRLKIPLPEKPSWWKIFNFKINDILKIVKELYKIYHQTIYID